MRFVFRSFFKLIVTDPMETPSFLEMSRDVYHSPRFLQRKSYTSCCPIFYPPQPGIYSLLLSELYKPLVFNETENSTFSGVLLTVR